MALRPVLSFLLTLLLASQASAGDGIDGRYGRTEVRYVAGKPAVFHKGQNVLALNEADAAAIFHVIPETSQDIVVIKSWKPGLNCHNSYRLLSIQSNGSVQGSPELGDCTELAGISFAGPSPIVHLRRAAGSKVEQLIWKDGRVAELPPVSEACFAKHEQAIESGRGIQPQQVAHLAATGEGRLQFFSAPDENCAIAGTFVVPGDRLDASRTHGRYSLVIYQHPKTAKVAAGWVESARLRSAN
jgi:hypothetical protein